MTGRMLLGALGATVLSVHLWHAHQNAVLQRQLSAMADVNGFIPVQMPDGAPADTVLILAPVNCPSQVAQRADALARELSRQGIPSIRRSGYSIAVVRRDMLPGIKRAFALSGAPPVVLLDGHGKSDPSAQAVIDEYHDDHS